MKTEIHILEPYSDVVGKLNELSFREGGLIATIGQISIILPSDLENRIRPFLGRRIKLLRTDLPHKEFLFRSIDEQDACKLDATKNFPGGD